MHMLSKAVRHLVIPLAVFAASGAVAADVGDYWIIYGKGERNKNEMYVADAMGIQQKPGGVQSQLILQFFQDPNMPAMAAFEIESNCAKKQLRFTSAKSVPRYGSGMSDIPVPKDWQAVNEYWLQRAFAFVCAPANRQANEMLPMGKMPSSQMLYMTQEMFTQLAPIEAKEDTLKSLDEMLGN